MTEILVEDIKIQIVRKKIKNIYIRVVPPNGEVRISAPTNVPDKVLQTFAESKLGWIKKHRHIMKNSPNKENSLDDNTTAYLWGKLYKIEVRENSKKNAYVSGNKIIIDIPKNTTAEQRESLLNELYRKELGSAIPSIMEKCEQIVGVRANEWRIKNMKTRWGTCNTTKKRVWLNLQLAKKPTICLEYVIIHELTHLIEPSHNKVFKAYMTKFCPNWKEIKKLLNS